MRGWSCFWSKSRRLSRVLWSAKLSTVHIGGSKPALRLNDLLFFRCSRVVIIITLATHGLGHWVYTCAASYRGFEMFNFRGVFDLTRHPQILTQVSSQNKWIVSTHSVKGTVAPLFNFFWGLIAKSSNFRVLVFIHDRSWPSIQLVFNLFQGFLQSWQHNTD